MDFDIHRIISLVDLDEPHFDHLLRKKTSKNCYYLQMILICLGPRLSCW